MAPELQGRLRFDHGCQFFRADTPRFEALVQCWLEKGYAQEFKGEFGMIGKATEFFGLPGKPPYYCGVGGMNSLCLKLLEETFNAAATSDEFDFELRAGERVESMTRDESTGLWSLWGKSGEAAYHDSKESVAQNVAKELVGAGFDAVVLTDLSSSFGAWHRASAGVPQGFADRVAARAGSRVPLFTSMVAYESSLGIGLDAMAIEDETVWFAAKSDSKGLGAKSESMECWSIVSTPEWAMRKIRETPMQDEATGAFIPQSKDYLTTVPAPEMEKAFMEALRRSERLPPGETPRRIYLNAQRWGSAMPAMRHLDEASSTRECIGTVYYDSGMLREPGSLAPTQEASMGPHFIEDEALMLFQCGDMVSGYSPGFEGAALSGLDLAARLVAIAGRRDAVE